MESLAAMLKENGLKVTPQRLSIYYLLYNVRSHPSAETIYKSLSASHPTMSLATVYKTLETFKVKNLVQELNVGEGCFRYDANTKSHPHFICYKCHSVIDLQINGFLDREEIARTEGLEILDERLYFYGYCSQCQGH